MVCCSPLPPPLALFIWRNFWIICEACAEVSIVAVGGSDEVAVVDGVEADEATERGWLEVMMTKRLGVV